jgi:hypothetical protein
MLRNILHSVEQQMSAQLSEIRAKFTQSGDKGTSIEDVFRTFLRQYLPRRLAIGHGEIIDRNSSRSGQTDVVVVNDDHPFTFTPDKPGIFFIEGVSAVGEVKTVLNSTHLNSIIAASRKFKALRITHAKGTMIHTNPSDRERFYTCPPYFLFAFESELSFPTIIDTLNAAAPDITAQPYPLVDAVFVMNKGWAVNFGDGQGGFQFVTPEGKPMSGWVWQPAEFVLFECLAWLSAVMPHMVRYEPVIIGYMIPHKPKDTEPQNGA